MPVVLSDGFSLYYALFNLNEQGNAQLQFLRNPLILPSPYDVGGFEGSIVGSCNGLLSLHLPETFLLWNPATRTHHVFPDPPYEQERRNKGCHIDVHGLGYVELDVDYKFLIVYQFVGHENGIQNFDPEVWIYSLNSESWSKIEFDEFPYHLKFGRGVTDVFVNGCLHYIVNRKIKSSVDGEGDIIDSENLIAAFDVSAETFKLIEKPDFVVDQKFELGVLDDRLCMILNENDFGRFRFLEMAVYGNGSSWIEVFRFERNDGPIGMRPVTSVLNEDHQKHVLM